MNILNEDLLRTILIATEKHPHTKISKLVKSIESERNLRQVVLLLIELAEHPEFSTDVSVSLQYYLDMFEKLSKEPSFAEAGIVLLNSATIYSKRVDNIHESVRRLIYSLLNFEIVKERNANATTEVIKRGKKRPLEHNTGYAVDMDTKRFKAMSKRKRFKNTCSNTSQHEDHTLLDNVTNDIGNVKNEYIHPTGWKYSVIEDYFDDEIDSKKHLKLFTFHMEHRYNTLISDINFKMYFKVKDFIDTIYMETSYQSFWPPLSDAFIDHYVSLENHIFSKEGHCAKSHYSYTKEKRRIIKKKMQKDMTHLLGTPYECDRVPTKDISSTPTVAGELKDSESGILHKHNESFDISINQEINEASTDLNIVQSPHRNILHEKSGHLSPNLQSQVEDMLEDSGINCSSLENSQIKSNEKSMDETLFTMHRNSVPLDSKCDNEDLTAIKVILPHLDDEGVFFSELDEHDQQMLSPAVIATDVFRCVKDKRSITVVVDDVIKRILNIQEPPRKQVVSLPVISCLMFPPITLNIFKIHYKYFKKRHAFKLGTEFQILKKERCNKFSFRTKFPCHPRTWVRLSEDVIGVPVSPPSTPNYEPDFYGFPEEIWYDKNRTLSRDSGISLQQIDITCCEDFKQGKDICDNAVHTTSNESGLSSMHLTSNHESENSINTTEGPAEIESYHSSNLQQHLSLLHDIQENNCNHDKLNNMNPQLNNDEIINMSNRGSGNERTSVLCKIQKWHKHLQPILANSNDRHYFDVLELGNEIISQFNYDCNTTVISLKHVMKNKDNSLISRYFLSSLLLASRGNINMTNSNNNSEAPSEWNDVMLKIVRKESEVPTTFNNIEERSPKISVVRPIEEPAKIIIRTLKPVCLVEHTVDHDSGISMSDKCST